MFCCTITNPSTKYSTLKITSLIKEDNKNSENHQIEYWRWFGNYNC